LIRPITASAVIYLCCNMRPIDAAEIFNNRNHESPDRLADEVIVAAAFGKAGIAEIKGRPVGIVGVTPIWSGVWSIWSFGTAEWPKGVLSMTRFGVRVLRPYILERGAHRLQCESRIDHHDAHRWLKACGARVEGTLRRYGRDGTDYLQFAWTKDDADVLWPR
jgi:RimJ/RimL family protein N-acetyltransferase